MKLKIQYSEALQQLIEENNRDNIDNRIVLKKKSFFDFEEINDDIILTIELNKKYETNISSNTEFSSLEEMQQQLKIKRDSVKEFYAIQKDKLINKLDMDNYNYYSSNYTSFIQIQFDDVKDFIDHESKVIELINDNDIKIDLAYADINKKFEKKATIDDKTKRRDTYNLQTSFKEVGVLNQNGNRHTSFTGAGINVGIFEIYSPKDTQNYATNIVAGSYLNTNFNIHGDIVSTIIGGQYGIATNANYFLVASSNSSQVVSCMEWFIEKNVNVINASRGVDSLYAGKYLAYDKYIDELIENTDVSFIVAAEMKVASKEEKLIIFHHLL